MISCQAGFENKYLDIKYELNEDKADSIVANLLWDCNLVNLRPKKLRNRHVQAPNIRKTMNAWFISVHKRTRKEDNISHDDG